MEIKVNIGGLCILASITMAILKLAEVITFSWWLVLLPVLIPTGVIALIFGVALGVGIFVWVLAFFAELLN